MGAMKNLVMGENPVRKISIPPSYEPESPSLLVREFPAAAPYPIEALGPLKPAAEAIQDKTQAPAALACQSVLGVAALAVQAHYDVELLQSTAPTSLFLITVAESGERKSSCDREAMKAVETYQQELSDDYRKSYQSYKNSLAAYEQARRVLLKEGQSDFGEAEAKLNALGDEPEPPLSPAITACDPTFEGLTKSMHNGQPAIGIYSDEGGTFLGGYGLSVDNRLKTLAGISSMWGGAPVRRWRAGDGVSLFHGRRLSMHLMVQPVAATSLLADPIARGQGFLSRCLIVHPPSAIGSRTRLGHRESSDREIGAFHERIGELLRRPKPVRADTRNELEPTVLRLSSEARLLLEEFAVRTELAQADGQPLVAIRPLASKAVEHAARLAAVLNVIDDPEAKTVSGSAMTNGIQLVEYYLSEACRLADIAVLSEETEHAERMRRWLVGSWSEEYISASDAAQRGPFPETRKARKALVYLEEFGWLTKCSRPARILGKSRREAWRVTRPGPT